MTIEHTNFHLNSSGVAAIAIQHFVRQEPSKIKWHNSTQFSCEFFPELQFLYLHRKWKFWWHVEINSNRTIDVDPILQGDFVKCNTLPRPSPPILIVRICWDSDFKLCIAVHGNFQGHGNFHGYQLWVLHGIFHGPWKFPWGSLSQIPRPWKFPWGREISMRVLISPQTGGDALVPESSCVWNLRLLCLSSSCLLY